MSLLIGILIFLLCGGFTTVGIVLAIVFYINKHKTNPLPPNQQTFNCVGTETDITNMEK
jgi:hypothetical protein